jgi:hypothetical protein
MRTFYNQSHTQNLPSGVKIDNRVNLIDMSQPTFQLLKSKFLSCIPANDFVPATQTTLNPTSILKLFPKSFPDCPIGDLQFCQSPYIPVLDETPGSTLEIDFKGKLMTTWQP